MRQLDQFYLICLMVYTKQKYIQIAYSIMKISNPTSYHHHKNSLSLTRKLSSHKSSSKQLGSNSYCQTQYASRNIQNLSLQTPTNSAILNTSSLNHDARQYRILIHKFAHNINTFYGKEHKTVLGELEQLYKIPLTNQQRNMMQKKVSSIFKKNIDKFMRQMVHRNSQILKARQEYLNSYHRKVMPKQRVQALFPTENPEKEELKAHQRKRPMSSMSFQKRRTLSERYDNNNKPSSDKSASKQALGSVHTIINTHSNSNKTQDKACAYHIEDEQVFIAENFRKTLYNTRPTNFYPQNQKENQSKRSKYRNKAQQKNIFVHEQFLKADIYVCQSFQDKSNIEYNPHDQRKNYAKVSQEKNRKIDNFLKENEGEKGGNRKEGRLSLEEYEKLRIQERLLTINQSNAPSIIQSQFQGYRPKSRCWGPNQSKPEQKNTSKNYSTLQNSPTTSSINPIKTRAHQALNKYKTIRSFK